MAQYQMLVDLNMNGNQLLSAIVENVADVPEEIKKGRIVIVTADNTLQYCDGTQFKVIATNADLQAYQAIAQKGQANGYAPLDGNSQVPLANLLTGNVADAVVVLNAPLTEGQILQWNGTGFVGYTLSNIYTYKGTVSTYDDLPDEGQQVGDVWNVETAYQTYPAGTNFAWDGTKWDALGGSVDLSGYQTLANLAQNFTSPSSSTYPSTQAVKTALDGKVSVLAEGPSAGTYTKVTVDASGLVTAGAQLVAGDIPALSQYELNANKGVANGYASLNESAKVPIAQIPTGNGANLIPVLPSAGTAGQVITVNEDADGFTFSTIAVNPIGIFRQLISGDGTTATWTYPHGLDGQPAGITLYDASKNIVGAQINADGTNVTVTMNTAPAIGTNYTLVCIG